MVAAAALDRHRTGPGSRWPGQGVQRFVRAIECCDVLY
jgi:hypothetical protein